MLLVIVVCCLLAASSRWKHEVLCAKLRSNAQLDKSGTVPPYMRIIPQV